MISQTSLAELHALLSRLPPYYPSWDYLRVMAFKKAIANALKQSRANNPVKFDNAMHSLRGFYQLRDQASALVAVNEGVELSKSGTDADTPAPAGGAAAVPDFVGSPRTITSGLLCNGCTNHQIDGGFSFVNAQIELSVNTLDSCVTIAQNGFSS